MANQNEQAADDAEIRENDVEEDGRRTPSKKVRLNVVGESGGTADVKEHTFLSLSGPQAEAVAMHRGGVVTPAAYKASAGKTPSDSILQSGASNTGTRRQLFSKDESGKTPVPTTPARLDKEQEASPVKRKLLFGRVVTEIRIQDNVKKVYSIIGKMTGSLGGNASCGPIYGELTMGSMQKIINLMKEHTGFNASSRFIDVGSGIGKPNLHVAQDPGVEFSYGIEIDQDRWLLGMSCLKAVLNAAKDQQQQSPNIPDDRVQIRHRCLFEHGDIRKAHTFDPFTHVYMFSIGFPPSLWVDLADMWNRSTSMYMICYHPPKDIINAYGFHVELIKQTPTSMHGSKEGHMGYIYRRKPLPRDNKRSSIATCDPLFQNAREQVNGELDPLRSYVNTIVEQNTDSTTGPRTRASRKRL